MKSFWFPGSRDYTPTESQQLRLHIYTNQVQLNGLGELQHKQFTGKDHATTHSLKDFWERFVDVVGEANLMESGELLLEMETQRGASASVH